MASQKPIPLVQISDFVNVSIPTLYATEAIPDDQDFHLTVSSSLIDAGAAFDNILDLDILSGFPDIGVYELGQSTPNYGHDFDNVCNRIDLSQRTWNGMYSKACMVSP